MKNRILIIVSLLAFILLISYVIAAAPVITLNFPTEGENLTTNITNFNATITGNDISNVTLYGNWTGTWEANETDTSGINDSNYNFTINLGDGTYIWNIYACDNSSNCTYATENITFTIDTTFPIILFVENLSTDNESTLINWTTNENTNSTVYYGTGTDLTNGTNSSANWTQTHLLGIFGLTNNTLYYYNITSCDYTGHCTINGTYNFTTSQYNDTYSPIITAVTNSTTYNDSTLINWTTNENANSSIVYGTDETLTNGTNSSATLTQSHTLGIYNLNSNTLYYYNVTSCDVLENCNTTGPHNFTTSDDPTASTIENITLSDYIVQNVTEVVVTVNVTPGTFNLINVSANNIELVNNSGLNEPGIWNGTINLTDNTQNVTIVVIDEYALTTTDTINYTIDITNPIITITNPSNGNLSYTNNVTINWTTNETNFKNASYKLDTARYENALTNNSTNLINISAGFHKVIIRVFDEANNVGYGYVNFTVISNANVNETIINIQNQNPGAYGFNISDFNSSFEYTNNGSANLTNISLNITFFVNQTAPNTSDSEVNIVNISGYNITWGANFTVTNQSMNASNNITGGGSTPLIIVNLNNLSNFIQPNSNYYGKVIFNVTNLTWNYVHYCSTDESDSCVSISQCTNNTFNNTNQLNCYTNNTDKVYAYVSHFSTIAVSLDNTSANITVNSPNNSINTTSGMNLDFNFTTTELVTGNFLLDDNYTQDLGSAATSFSFKLNGTLNRTQLGTGILTNGIHNITININDSKNNANSTTYYFNVSDYYSPTVTSISISGTSTSSTSGTATITAVTNEYSYCWISSTSTINASADDMSTHTLMSGLLATSHTYNLEYSSDSTKGPYYISCRDALFNNMSYANSTGSFSVNVGEESSGTTGGNTGGNTRTTYTYYPDEDPTPNPTSTPNTTIPPTKESITITYSTNVNLKNRSLETNDILKEAFAKILSKESLDKEYIQNLLNASENLSGLFLVRRDFESTTGKTKVVTVIEYDGYKTINNLMIYEIIPKEFANSDMDMVVTSSSGKIQLVKDDPEYLIMFKKLNPGDLLTITYETNKELETTVLNGFVTELYAESSEEYIPPKKTSNGWIVAVAVILFIVIIIIYISRRGHKFGKKPARQHETWGNKILDKLKVSKNEDGTYQNLRDKYLKK